MDRCAFAEENVGKRVKRTYKFLATGDWILTVERRCTCPGNQHMLLMTDPDEEKTGNQEVLKESQAYPDSLGEALVGAWSAELPDKPWGDRGVDAFWADFAATGAEVLPWGGGLQPKKRARKGPAW